MHPETRAELELSSIRRSPEHHADPYDRSIDLDAPTPLRGLASPVASVKGRKISPSYDVPSQSQQSSSQPPAPRSVNSLERASVVEKGSIHHHHNGSDKIQQHPSESSCQPREASGSSAQRRHINKQDTEIALTTYSFKAISVSPRRDRGTKAPTDPGQLAQEYVRDN
eukprot:gene22054-8641_t